MVSRRPSHPDLFAPPVAEPQGELALPPEGIGEELLIGRLGRVLFEAKDRPDVLAEFFTLSGRRVVVSGNFVRTDFQSPELSLHGRSRPGRTGPIFRVRSIWRGPGEQAVLDLPPDDGVAALLVEVVKGVGPKTAERLVSALAPFAWNAVTKEPYALAKVVGLERALEIQRQVVAIGLDRACAMAHLMSIGLSWAYAQRALAHFGSEALQVVRDDPYRLTELDGVRFAIADRIGVGRFGLTPTDPRRLQALAVAVLQDAAGEGHTSLSRDEVVTRMRELGDLEKTGIDPAAVLHSVVQQQRLVYDMGDYYLPALHRAEVRAAEALAQLAERPERPVPLDVEQDPTLAGYTTEQRGAIARGLSAPVLLVLGRPGSGKTSIARELVRLAQQHGETVTLAATTATAAERMTEAICQPSKIPGTAPVDYVPQSGTIHSLVGMDWPGNPLPPGVVIIDEFSMADLPLLARIVANAGPETRLVMLGDPNQLPPVVAGNATRDLRTDAVIPAVELKTVHRQEGATLLAFNLERVLSGQLPYFHGQAIPPAALAAAGFGAHVPPAPRPAPEPAAARPGPADRDAAAETAAGQIRPLVLPGPVALRSNCFFREASTPAVGADKVVDAVQRFARSKGLRRDGAGGGYDAVREIRVFSPMKKGFMGTGNLNRRLQAVLNPAPAEVRGGPTERGRAVKRLTSVRLPVASPVTRDGAKRAHVLAVGDPVVIAVTDGALGLRPGVAGTVAGLPADGSVVLRVGPRDLVIPTGKVGDLLRTDFPLEIRVGDPVVQTKNVQGRPVFQGTRRVRVNNGARGTVVQALEDGGAVIEFLKGVTPFRLVYTASQLGELALAYATTVHKGQGQEAPVSILAVHPSEHFKMLDKSLLYVGMSRGTEQFCCVGTSRALHMCLRHSYGLARRTRLTERVLARRKALQAGEPARPVIEAGERLRRGVTSAAAAAPTAQDEAYGVVEMIGDDDRSADGQACQASLLEQPGAAAQSPPAQALPAQALPVQARWPGVAASSGSSAGADDPYGAGAFRLAPAPRRP